MGILDMAMQVVAGIRRSWSSLSVPTYAALFAAALIALSIGAVSLLSSHQIRNQVENQQLVDHQRAIAAAARAVGIGQNAIAAKISDTGMVERLETAALAAPQREDSFDAIAQLTRGIVTLLAWDADRGDFRRIGTSIVAADGKRAVGSYLGKDTPHFMALKAGQVFSGASVVRDQPFHILILPVFAQGGNVVGGLGVGVPVKDVAGATASFRRQVVAIGVGLSLMLIPLAFFAFRRMLRPLRTLSGTLGPIPISRTSSESLPVPSKRSASTRSSASSARPSNLTNSAARKPAG
jgi:methyl-accepting chemotaxis protein